MDSAAGRRAGAHGSEHHRVRHQNITFIEPDMWPPNSPDLNPVDYAIWGALQERVYHGKKFENVEQFEAGDRAGVARTVTEVH